jgi:hypothetical protein
MSARAQPTRLTGRESELASIQRCLLDDDVGLVSLVGPAGVGMTRLALEVQSENASLDSLGDCRGWTQMCLGIERATLVTPSRVADTINVLLYRGARA